MTLEEEYRLIVEAKSNSQKSIDALVENNQGLIHMYLKRFKCKGTLEYNDLFNTGIIGLLHAVSKFDVNSGNKFSTYAYYWIRATIRREAIYHDKVVNLPADYPQQIKADPSIQVSSTSIDNVVNEDGDTFHEYHADEQGLDWLADIESADIHTALHEALEWIDAEDADVLRLYYFEGLTQLQIKDRLGMSEGSVKNCLRTGVAGLKHVMRKLAGITSMSADS